MQRTPQRAFFKCIFNAVSVDRELPETFEVDLLPEWIKLQQKMGIR
ncbi:MAG TPA: hypothetical protein VKR58_08390 [Aquella sp.]|nr:hypothetical protein [Aquella sp.]